MLNNKLLTEMISGINFCSLTKSSPFEDIRLRERRFLSNLWMRLSCLLSVSSAETSSLFICVWKRFSSISGECKRLTSFATFACEDTEERRFTVSRSERADSPFTVSDNSTRKENHDRGDGSAWTSMK